VKDEGALASVLHIVASSLELLYGHMGIFWEEYDIPVVVSHSRRLVLLFVQYANKKVAAAWLEYWCGLEAEVEAQGQVGVDVSHP
jgi:hypothetical protein